MIIRGGRRGAGAGATAGAGAVDGVDFGVECEVGDAFFRLDSDAGGDGFPKKRSDD